MGDNSGIEWTDATWNPVRGCTKISPGCKHCYAETFAERWRGVPGHPYEQGFDLRLVPEKLEEPLRWRRPRRIFVNSMSDLFHERIPFNYIDQVFAVMQASPQHTFQVLTKRADRIARYMEGADERVQDAGSRLAAKSRWCHANEDTGWPLANVWLGVSVEDRKYGLPRIDHLRVVPAAVRMLSVEPLLEDLGELNLDGIGWVIVGGESGPGARPMRPEWARSVRDQCVAAGVPFFFKQWGGVDKKAAGNVLDGRTWLEFPKQDRKEQET